MPLRWRISRSTRPSDIRPRVRPDMIPAKRTRKQETPAYTNHDTDPNGISSPTLLDWPTIVNILAPITAFIGFIFDYYYYGDFDEFSRLWIFSVCLLSPVLSLSGSQGSICVTDSELKKLMSRWRALEI